MDEYEELNVYLSGVQNAMDRGSKDDEITMLGLALDCALSILGVDWPQSDDSPEFDDEEEGTDVLVLDFSS